VRAAVCTLILIGLLAFAGQARASDPRGDRPWAARGEAFVLSGSGFPGGAFALTMQRTLWRRFAWEETLGWGYRNREGSGRDIGWTFAGTARAAAWMSAGRTHALTVGLGTALIVGGGTRHFVFGELGYEYRSPAGLALIVAAGPNLEHGELELLGHLRAGLGWAF
jgi:hypothetical protein